MPTLVLAVLQIGPDTDPAPALASVAATRRVLVRPPALADLPTPPGVETAIDARLERAAIAAHVRRSPDELVAVLRDDEHCSPALAAALGTLAHETGSGRWTAAHRVRFLGREIASAPTVFAWRGDDGAADAAPLAGEVVTTSAGIAAAIDRLERAAQRPYARPDVGVADFVWRPLAAVTRRLWRRRRSGVPGLVLSVLETFGEVLAAAHAWERRGIAARREESQRGLPAGFHLWRTPWGFLALRDGTPETLREMLLDATPDAASGAPVPGGRGAVWALALGGTDRGVLRWYRRGGLVRWFVRDRYFGFTPRPIEELIATEAARSRGVAAPEVLAARVDRLRFGSYRGALVTRALAGAETLREVLVRLPTGPARAEALHAVGRSVRRLHDAGVDHRDLNAGNILLTRDDGLTVWFIDFDRARLLPTVGARARTRALGRLARSLAKLARAGMPFAPADLTCVRAAYDDGGGAGAP